MRQLPEVHFTRDAKVPKLLSKDIFKCIAYVGSLRKTQLAMLHLQMEFCRRNILPNGLLQFFSASNTEALRPNSQNMSTDSTLHAPRAN